MKSTLHVVFTATTLRDDPPPQNAAIVVVRYVRQPDTFAEAADTLTKIGREFHTTWLDRAGTMWNADPETRRRAERFQAQALAISLTAGKATQAKIYGDEIETVKLDN
jgi:hypothetical protein